MSSRQPADPRLYQALELLRSLMNDTGGLTDAKTEGPWVGLRSPMPAAPAMMSSTDLLTVWPMGQPPISSPFFTFDQHQWEVPFGPAPHISPVRSDQPVAPLIHHQQPLMDESLSADVTGAVDCLYDFIHALGRLDVQAALAFVSADYHTIDDHRSIDHQGLRRQLEKLLDPYRESRVAVSLSEIPVPIPYPDGVLIHCVIQIDADSQDEEILDSTVIKRVAVLNSTADGSWLITGLSLVEDL